jgi:preprotein translocase subunit SecA
MLKKFVRLVGGDPAKREIEKHNRTVADINALEPAYEALSDEALAAKTDEFRQRIIEQVRGAEDEDERRQLEQQALNEILPEAFAAVREASKRTIGLRHFDVQLIGGIALHQGKIAEMRTGEGKTLVATLPIYLNALTGRGVHLITVNDYLARRDARWMAPIYNMLGMSVGVLQMAARTENGKKAFLVDLERQSPHEDQHQLQMVPRIEAYSTDITYGTNSEFGFDYLRDNMTMSLEDRVQRGHYYAIIDEADNVLIDEARTPLIISGPAQDEAEMYYRMAQVVKGLRPEDYEVSEKDRTVTLSEIGEAHVEDLLGQPLRDPERPEDITSEQAHLLGNLEQALRAQFLFKRNKDYLVQAGKVIIIDEFTGRMMPGRRWSDGLHQAVEAKEGVRVQSESVTYATITIQNYFRMYQKLAGMTGTAITEAEEFDKIYKLAVLAIPTNLEYQAMKPDAELEERESRDEAGYKYSYYARKSEAQGNPVFWRRQDYPDVVYRSEEAKLRAIAREILRYHTLGRPLLVGTTSVELSERVSARLRAAPLRRLAQVLLLRDACMRAHNDEEDGRQIAELQFLNAPLESLEDSAMRKLARELGISFTPEDPANLQRMLAVLDLSEEHTERLREILQGGIQHEVLNARKHTEESQIIAGAGAFGAVTIATNMAGRGVDIKLGGELAEEILAAVNRILNRAGYKDPYDMSMEERQQALLSMDPSAYGIYEAEVRFFLKHMDDMELVRKLGGLHVIGSVRHEARRIDNQLRGRAARQGDPGSSRFYLSMEDELMRLFGGQQADNLMQRLKIDDALPLEVGLVGRLVEQSQTRVEGANFDVRKHLLEYDDVLNTQRAAIYSQRNRIFTKEDLTEDVTDMLRAEVTRRIPEARQDEGGPWKLLAWLETVQPTLDFGSFVFPSYTYRLLLDHLKISLPTSSGDLNTLRQVLLDLVGSSLGAEKSHLISAFANLCEQAEERLESQLNERLDTVDTFFEGITLEDEEGKPFRPADLLNELSSALHLPIKLSAQDQRALLEDPRQVKDEVRRQVKSALGSQAIARLVGAVERRLEDSLDLDLATLSADNWQELSGQVLNAAEVALDKRQARYLGAGGQIAKELDNTLARFEGLVTEQHLLRLLLLLPRGARASFDQKTHRRVFQHTTRLNYIYFAAQVLEDRQPEDVAQDVLTHLEKAQETIQQMWGLSELSRLASASFGELDESTRLAILSSLEVENTEGWLEWRLGELPGEQQKITAQELGRRALTNVYRMLLLGIITELWVEYLTQMEALRVSIGLEAYAQRDPLVQYKNKAFELFQNLLKDMRLGVISRMFTFRPRDLSRVQAAVTRSEASQLEPEADQEPEIFEEEETPLVEAQSAVTAQTASKPASPAAASQRSGKKRRRHRR